MKINNLIVKIFLGIYLVIIISGIVIFENIGFAGGGLEKSIHTASNSETQPVTVKDISSETVSRTTPAATVKETASSQDVTKQEAVTNTQTAAVASETTSKSSESETTQTEPETTQTVAQPSYTFANGRITNTSALKSYRVTGASYVNMHKDKNGSHSFAVVPGGTTGSISSVGAYYTLIDYNGTSGYVYNSYLEVY
jgi:CCR4-NOT transcriptional regulation complex NOT5 subunit